MIKNETEYTLRILDPDGVYARVHDVNGVMWIACTERVPIKGKVTEIAGERVRVYHPDSKVVESSCDGGEDHFECPHCKDSWWVEYDAR